MDRDAWQAGMQSRDEAPLSSFEQGLPRRHAYRPRGLVLQNGRWVDPRAGPSIERDDPA
jgi:hypothetical protein